MYSLDCSYYKAEFETIDELIEAATINGMDPNYEITFDGEGIGEQLEWLIDMLVKENELTLKGENYKLFEIAKQMENEQIIDAYETSHISMMTAKQYYSETFNKEI
jgi:hypothetical protein